MNIIDLIFNTMSNIITKLNNISLAGVSILQILVTLLLMKLIFKVFVPSQKESNK
jgi:hypothetical protein